MRRMWLVLAAMAMAIVAIGGQERENEPLHAEGFDRFDFRSLGPTLTTGRISDIEVDPQNPSVWYVAASSGNLWKTENRGATWTPIFDHYGSFSLGVVVVDPRDSKVVWLGTGENNNQRSVAFGDGVYKSTDAGKTWAPVGRSREFRAHRPHSDRPPQLERRLRRRDRAVVVGGGLSRVVQDD